MALNCSTCEKHSYDLHPELKICFDCFKAGESERFKRSKVIALSEYRDKNALRLMQEAYNKTFTNR